MKQTLLRNRFGKEAATKPAAEGIHKSSNSAKRKSPTAAVQRFDRLLVLDLEATCSEAKNLHPQEIIEFSSCILDVHSLKIVDQFQRYCRPTENPVLTAFCSELTGIKQSWVDDAPHLEEVLRQHDEWLRNAGLNGTSIKFAAVTWGSWDCQVQIESECKWRDLKRVPYLRRWIDLKVAFTRRLGSAIGLRRSVEKAGLVWEGRAHSGLDDALNTARLAAYLMQQGEVLELTGWFEDAGPKQLKQATLFPGRAAKKHKTIDAATGKPNGNCACGVKAKRRQVKRPGANLGREFLSCGKWSITGGSTCDFFFWLDDNPFNSTAG